MGLQDRTASLVRAGYLSGWLRARTSGPTSLLRPLLRRSLVVRGEVGVDLFYDTERVGRRSAAPGSIALTIFGRGAVHTLDDAAHRHRKKYFLEVTAPRPKIVSAIDPGAAARRPTRSVS